MFHFLANHCAAQFFKVDMFWENSPQMSGVNKIDAS